MYSLGAAFSCLPCSLVLRPGLRKDFITSKFVSERISSQITSSHDERIWAETTVTLKALVVSVPARERLLLTVCAGEYDWHGYSRCNPAEKEILRKQQGQGPLVCDQMKDMYHNSLLLFVLKSFKQSSEQQI